MKNQGSSDDEKAKAVDELINNVSALGSAVTEKVKDTAMNALQEKIEDAKDKTRQVLVEYDPSALIRAHPQLAVAAGFILGGLIGTRTIGILKPFALAALSFGAESFMRKKLGMTDEIDGRMLH